MSRLRSRRAAAVIAVLACSVLVGAAPAWAQDERDCSDFATQQEAQRFFEDEGGPQSDPNMLDPDRDGQACEGLPSGSPVPTTSPAATTVPTATPDSELPNNGSFSGLLALSGLTFVEIGVGLSMLASRMRQRRRLPSLSLLRTLASAAKSGRKEDEVGPDAYLVRRRPTAGTRPRSDARPARPVDGIRRRRPEPRSEPRSEAGRVSLRQRAAELSDEPSEPHDWPFFTPPGS